MDLNTLNNLSITDAENAFEKCCGSKTWYQAMAKSRPFSSSENMYEIADQIWLHQTDPKDWMEAFTHHPKIGDIDSLKKKFASTKEWAGNEQAGMNAADLATIEALAKGNTDYEQRHGYIFIVCATGKSAAEMLALLEKRLPNDPEEELLHAMEEQRKITNIRLKKLLTE